MKKFKKVVGRSTDWIIAAGLGVLAAILYFASMANYVFPGEAARLQVLWSKLDIANVNPSPLMEIFTRFLGFDIISPVIGVVAVITLYHLVSFFVRERIGGEMVEKWSVPASRFAGVVAAVVFMLTPAVRGAATHLSARMFDAAWALVIASLMIPASRLSKKFTPLFALLIGALSGLGLADSALFIALIPLYIVAVAVVDLKRGKKPYLDIFLFIMSYLLAFSIFAGNNVGDFLVFARDIAKEFKGYFISEGWLAVAVVSTLPFVVALFSSYNAYNEESKFTQWFFHICMTILSIVAISTPFAPSAYLEPFGVLPVVTSAFAAFVAGYVASYWALLYVAPTRKNESQDTVSVATKGKLVAMVSGGVYAVVITITLIIQLFSFDGAKGDFADKMADKILDDLGDRTWFVSDGTLDDHLRLKAKSRGKELNLICLNRDLDDLYLKHLSELVKAKNLGGSKNEELVLSLSLGVLPFVQDWFAADPNVADHVAIYGAPDLWYSAGFKSVPEFAFFGAKETIQCDWSCWKEFDTILKAPKGWGSYRLHRVKNPVDRMRLNIRRHLGFVANNRGVYLQDKADNVNAFKFYELVMNEIDADNVCALFNEFEMARVGYSEAAAKRQQLEKELKGIIADKDRRYYVYRLGNYYGYIRSPEIFIRLGFTWARSGRPGDALSQIRRAIEFVPSDRRGAIMNMMAALYANDDNTRKSRQVYEQVLANNADDHDALIGLMRLELIEGDSQKALQYLERAAKVGEGARAKIELSMVALMKNQLDEAKRILSEVTRENPQDMQAWSLLAAVTMQQCDSAKDKAAKTALEKELENSILPAMEGQSRDAYDYYVQTTKAFLLMRKGEEKRREARDAFIAAAKSRPDITATQDLVLGLDISLDDVESAEAHAKDILRKNRRAPLANYVMGSLALRRGNYDEAEAFLRRSADATRPVVLAMNDLAEVYRRKKNFDEAERYARMAVKTNPKLYVAWETLGSVLMDAKRNLDEAEESIKKACDLSKVNGHEEDIRMVLSLARVQFMRGDTLRARANIMKVNKRIGELSTFEKAEFEEFKKSVH